MAGPLPHDGAAAGGNDSMEIRAQLDATDWKILRELQKDGRLSNVALAARVGLSPPPCLRRVRALRRGGYIAGFRACRSGEARPRFRSSPWWAQEPAEGELKASRRTPAGLWCARPMRFPARPISCSNAWRFPALRISSSGTSPPYNVDSVKTTLIPGLEYEPECDRMSDIATGARGGWFGLISAAAMAVVVGFASTILLIMEAARRGRQPAQQALAAPMFRHGDHHFHSLVALPDADHHRLVDAGCGADCDERRRGCL
jgi:hypothetical protein